MCLKKGLPRLTSLKAAFITFLATLKQITQSYSSCITDCQHDFEMGILNIEAPSSLCL